ncbi:hypothetical protein KFE25_006995 [Diacronema lutheri]|uniref:Uncharacterized protein n=2 Tax=Diacronema lutheri TaxID=2081491 RepID=A0A8J5XI63_DIALT|nr:hypothetical protein KFE25_006995 [Diacronema lutheri]
MADETTARQNRGERWAARLLAIVDVLAGAALVGYFVAHPRAGPHRGDAPRRARALVALCLPAAAVSARGAGSLGLRCARSAWRRSASIAWLTLITLAAFALAGVELAREAHVAPPGARGAVAALRALACYAAVAAAAQLVLLLRDRSEPCTRATSAPLLEPAADGNAGERPAAAAPAAAPARGGGGGKLWRILALARPEAPTLAFGTLALLLDSTASLLVPKFFGGLVDSVAVRDGRALRAQTGQLVGLLAIGAGMTFGQQLAYGIAGEKIVARLRAHLFRRILAQDASFFDVAKSGELISRLSSDCTKLQDAATNDISALVASAASCTVAVALMFATQWRLTLVTLAVIPPMVGAAVVYGRAISRLSRAYQDKLSAASGISAEALGALKTVRAFAGEPLQLAAYVHAVGDPDGEGLLRVPLCALRSGVRGLSAYALGVVRSLWLGAFVSAITLAFFLAIVAILWYGCLLVLRGVSTLGELVAFVLYAVQIGGSMGAIASHMSAFAEAIGASSRVFELIDRVPALPSLLDAPGAPTVGGSASADGALAQPGANGDGDAGAPAVPRVCFERVSFAYAAAPDQPVLRDVSLAVPRGSTVALVGPSGAGKSTVSSLLLRMYAPTSGRVLLDGRDLATVDLLELRSRVGVVAQEPVLFAASIFENIAYGARSREAASAGARAAGSVRGGSGAASAAAASDAAALRVRVEDAARRAHCTEFIASFADGYETLVGERGVRLSGGQKQRVAIARALLMSPPVLVLDEATSALDAESEALVVAALDTLTSGRTTLVIAHRLSTVVNADQIVCMVEGRVAGAGTHVELFKSCAAYASLITRQLAAQHADRDALASNAGPGRLVTDAATASEPPCDAARA